VQGGSTLTQQLVKNYFLSDEQTFGRKATEAVMALRLEAHFSKEEILVAYLNEVYLGQDGARAIHGFGLGSEYYFAKPLAELDVGELALLIGMVKGPPYYDPRKHADRARARRNLVLQELAEAHLIDAEAAKRAPPRPRPAPAGRQLRAGLSRSGAPAFEARLCRGGSRRRGAVRVHQPRSARAGGGGARADVRILKRLDAASRVRGDHLEGAVIVAEPNSGDVVAVVGGRDVGTDGSTARSMRAGRSARW
jgi:penicillin-binding protein 1B